MSVFIMKRGIVLPKYIWNRYSIAYTETAGSSATVSRYYSYTTMVSSAYTLSNTTFTLNNPSATKFYNIKVGNYLVSTSTNSTNTSGSTLYKITKDAERPYELYHSSSFSDSGSYTYNSSTIFYGYTTATHDTTSNTITLSGATLVGHISSIKESPYSGIYYSEYGYLYTSMPESTITGLTECYRARVNTKSDNEVSWLIGDVSIEKSSYATFAYTPYTSQSCAGTLIDMVESTDPAAYPTNGIQDGYWYVLQS